MWFPLFSRNFLTAIFIMSPLFCYPQKWRVIERTQYLIYNGVYNQGALNRFTYDVSSNRGSNYSNDTINYDVNEISPVRRGYRTYNSNNQLLSDTYVELKAGNIWKATEADSFVYSNGLLIRHDEYRIAFFGSVDSLALNNEYAYVYNSLGLLQTKTTTGYSGKLRPDPYVMWNYYEYDSSGRLIKDSIILDKQGMRSELEMTTFDYDSSGNMLVKDYYKWDSANKKIISKTEYGYNSNGLKAWTKVTGYNVHGTSYLVSDIVHVYNTAGQRIADTTVSGYPFNNTSLTLYYYTPFGYYSELQHGTFDGAGNLLLNMSMKYKYEHYWSADVSKTGIEDESIAIYPNPADNMLYIKTDKAIESGVVYNSTGVVVHVLNKNDRAVDIRTLLSGNYYLQVIVAGEVVLKRFAVVK